MTQEVKTESRQTAVARRWPDATETLFRENKERTGKLEIGVSCRKLGKEERWETSFKLFELEE